MRYIRNATIINDGQRMTINELLLITSQNLPHAKIYILYNYDQNQMKFGCSKSKNPYPFKTKAIKGK